MYLGSFCGDPLIGIDRLWQAEDAHRQLLLVEFAIFTELRESVVKVADIVLAVGSQASYCC